MRPPGPALRFWPALALVAAIHLLTTAGTWLVTDQSEAIYTARHLVETGRLTLRDDGSRPSELPFLRTVRGQPTRSRQLPLTMLSHVPLVVLDKLFGLERPGDYGRFVHLQGHLLVLGALALIGVTLERASGDPRGAAFAVTATGLCWPVWMASRNGCAEPVLLCLVTLWLCLGPGLRSAGQPARDGVRAACCALLSWVNPAGTVLAAGLCLAALLREPRRAAFLQCAGTLLGAATVVVFWNGLFHGNFLIGGYSRLGIVDYFRSETIQSSVTLQVRATAVHGLVLAAAAAVVAVRDRSARGELAAPGSLYLAMLALFAAFIQPEPDRRFAPVWPAFGLFVGRHYASLGPRYPWPALGLAAAFGLGFHEFFAAAGRGLLGPDGLYWPSVLWVRLLLEGAPRAWVAIAVAALALVALRSAERVAALLRDDGPSPTAC